MTIAHAGCLRMAFISEAMFASVYFVEGVR